MASSLSAGRTASRTRTKRKPVIRTTTHNGAPALTQVANARPGRRRNSNRRDLLPAHLQEPFRKADLAAALWQAAIAGQQAGSTSGGMQGPVSATTPGYGPGITEGGPGRTYMTGDEQSVAQQLTSADDAGGMYRAATRSRIPGMDPDADLNRASALLGQNDMGVDNPLTPGESYADPADLRRRRTAAPPRSAPGPADEAYARAHAAGRWVKAVRA